MVHMIVEDSYVDKTCLLTFLTTVTSVSYTHICWLCTVLTYLSIFSLLIVVKLTVSQQQSHI